MRSLVIKPEGPVHPAGGLFNTYCTYIHIPGSDDDHGKESQQAKGISRSFVQDVMQRAANAFIVIGGSTATAVATDA